MNRGAVSRRVNKSSAKGPKGTSVKGNQVNQIQAIQGHALRVAIVIYNFSFKDTNI